MDRRALTRIGIGCAIMVLIPTIIVGWWAISWARGLAEWSERAEQFPTVSDLRGDAIPDDENAALVYRQAWEALDLSEDERTLLSSGEDPDAVLRILQTNRDALHLFHEAVAIERCRFEPVYDDDRPVSQLPHLGLLRDLTRLSNAEALLAGERGDVERSVEAVEAHVRLARHLMQSPLGTIEFVFARSQIHQASRSLERVLTALPLTNLQSASLRETLVGVDPCDALIIAHSVDVAEGLEFLDHAMREGFVVDREGEVGVPAVPVPLRWTIEINRAKYMELNMQELERLPRPFREVAELEPITRPESALYIWIELLGPFTGQLTAARDEIIANREMMTVALDITAFADEHGRLPESLGELPEAEADDYAADPFSGEQLRYRADDAGGYRLWSIGRNLRDNGGVSPTEAHQDPDTGYGEYDLVFGVSPAA